MESTKSQETYLPFKKARKIVHAEGIKNGSEWIEYCKNGGKPRNIPAAPESVYREYQSLGDWLGTGRSGNYKKNFLSYELAKKKVHLLGIKNRKGWIACRKNIENKQKLEGVPANPDRVYKNQGWIDWADWFGFSAG